MNQDYILWLYTVKTAFAKSFQKLIYEVILPSIRKYGSYHIEQQLAIKDEQLNESMEKLAIKDKELNEANQAKDKAELKALRIKKFMNNVKIKELKLEWIYIATTYQYAKERLFKIGSTERIAPYNTGGTRRVQIINTIKKLKIL